MFEFDDNLNSICKRFAGVNYKIEKLNGGINNPTYLFFNKKYKFVLKQIKAEPSPTFNNYLAEKQLLTLASTVAVTNVPKLISALDNERVLILEYIQPDNIENLFNVNLFSIKECINFIKKLNSDPQLSHKTITQRAADSSCKLSEHILNIDLRISNFNTDHLPTELNTKASELLSLLVKKWGDLKNESIEYLNNNPSINTIDENFMIVSPSDFGFHNIIIKNNKLVFIDFEFSGWDDPAKMYCDFILQPKFQIPREFYNLLNENFLNKEYRNLYKDRTYWLYKLLKFKWHTIRHSYLNKDKFKRNEYDFNFLKLKIENSKNELL
jgi:thiamine kinase-like enzyme